VLLRTMVGNEDWPSASYCLTVLAERRVVSLPDSAHLHAVKYGETEFGSTPTARSAAFARSDVICLGLDLSKLYW
jgi:hypothetical protein